MNRAIRYYIKFPRKYKESWCGCCNFVGYSRRAMKQFKRLPRNKHEGIMFKVRP